MFFLDLYVHQLECRIVVCYLEFIKVNLNLILNTNWFVKLRWIIFFLNVVTLDVTVKGFKDSMSLCESELNRLGTHFLLQALL